MARDMAHLRTHYRVTMTRSLLAPGDHAPDFTAPTDTGTFTLSDHRGESLILFFYPAAMTPGCTKEACDFRDSLGALGAAGYTVVGISKDSPEVLAQFRATEGLTYPLVSDADLAIQNTYGVWGQKNLYGKVIDGTIRSTIVVGPDGTVTHAFYNVKATGHVGRLRRDLGLPA